MPFIFKLVCTYIYIYMRKQTAVIDRLVNNTTNEVSQCQSAAAGQGSIWTLFSYFVQTQVML